VKKISLSCIVLLFLLSAFINLSGCSNLANNQTEKTIPVKTTHSTNPKEEEPHLNNFVPEIMFYTNNKISVWAYQLLFIKGGDAAGSLVNGLNSGKTKITLYYAKNEEIKEIELKDLALKYNLYGGIIRINISPTGKYIAVEMGTTDNNETILVDTLNNKASMLWYDEKNQNSVVSVSWKDNNDFVFAFFPSLGSQIIQTYNLKDHSINKIKKIEDKGFTVTNSIIQWTNESITVIDTNSKKVYKVK
jgi:hypothetical protein